MEKKSSDIISKNNRADYVASAAKSALGIVPFVGSLLTEIAGNIIPNQRIDRIVKFAIQLEKRLSDLEEAQIRFKLSDENFTDLLEESLHQASRSLSEERRTYISELVANSITAKDLEYFESKHLLRLLNELNDVEILWLRLFLNPELNGDIEFREKHKDILRPVGAHLGSKQPEVDKCTIQNSYKEHLASLGLLERKVNIDTSTKSSVLKTAGYEITSLGRLLLREVGLKE